MYASCMHHACVRDECFFGVDVKDHIKFLDAGMLWLRACHAM
jgi:hypothetical protein